MFKNNRSFETELECLPYNEIKTCTFSVDTIKVISLILHPVVSLLYYVKSHPPPQITTIQIYKTLDIGL